MKYCPVPFSLVALAALAGCAVGADYRRPDVALPAAYRNAAVLVAPTDDANWWAGFHDPMLDRVIGRVLAENLDLAAASARVATARAIAARAGAALGPNVAMTAGAASIHESLRSPIGAVTQAVGAPRDYDSFTVGPEASWELDLFGGLRRGREAVRADAEASATTRAAIRLAVTAEAADAYLTLRGLQARRDLAARRAETESHLVDLVGRRVAAGVAADRELERAVGEFERIRATIPPLDAALDAELDRLDVMMGLPAGRFRTELATAAIQPMPPLPSGSAAPADLLRRRPDVVAAEHRLAAENARIGVALDGYYPHLTLSGLLDFESTRAGDLFSNDALRTAGLVGLRWRLFDFGRVDAEVAIARGREAEALAAYRGAVLRATADVETALSRFVNAGLEAGALDREIAALTRARAEAEDGYEAGALRLLEVLDADRELLAASDRLALARSTEARAAVAAFRALGGGWSG